jgi:hypothetical protein
MNDDDGFVVTYNFDQLAKLLTEDAKRHNMIKEYDTLVVDDFAIKTNKDLDKFLKFELHLGSRHTIN